MKRRMFVLTSLLAAGLLMAFSFPALAKDGRTVEIKQDATLNGTKLPAGRYLVRWQTHSPEATVEFTHRREVVLSTEGRVEDRGKKYDSDTVVYDTAADGTMTICEIRFAGSSKVLVFKPLSQGGAN